MSQRRSRTHRRIVQSWAIGAGCVALFVVVAVSTAAITFFRQLHEEVATDPELPEIPEPQPGEKVNVLILGVDNGPEGVNTRSDTIIVASFDPASYRLSLLSLPRDTRVVVPGHGPTKLGHAHVYGGPRLAMKTVEDLLQIPIHYYVRCGLEGFSAIVDILGGVEVDVPQRMYYVDPMQHLVIDLMPGRQLLDGDKALQFVRFRGYHDGDLGRIKAQQQFLSALANKMFQVRTIFKLPAIAVQLAKHVDTNMTAADIIQFSRWAVNVKPDMLTMETLPGQAVYLEENGCQVSYLLVDPNAVREVVEKLFGGRSASPPIKVEVYNGSGRAGLARSLAEKLELLGFEVVTVANAERSDYEHTLVMGAPGAEAAREEVIRALKEMGVPVSLDESPTDGPQAGATVRIIIGMDYP